MPPSRLQHCNAELYKASSHHNHRPDDLEVAAVVGLAEEHPLQFEVSGLDNCVLNFSWRKGTQPQLGSVRPILEQLGAVEGDFLVLTFFGQRGNPVRIEAKLKSE